MEDRLLDDKEIARLLSIPVGSARHLRNVGKIPFVKVGRHPRVWLSVLFTIYKNPDTISPVVDGQREQS